jgi:hypothetical protein
MSSSEVAAEVAAAWPGWHVWVTRERKSIVATRTGPQQPVDDGVWARTVIADDWDQLELELAQQAACDATRA